MKRVPIEIKAVAVAGGKRIMAKCPKCGKWAGLNHTIQSDATIEPSVVCSRKDCGFHAMCELA